jgi:hypothetical protein
MSIYMAPRLGSAEPLTKVCNSAITLIRKPRLTIAIKSK